MYRRNTDGTRRNKLISLSETDTEIQGAAFSLEMILPCLFHFTRGRALTPSLFCDSLRGTARSFSRLTNKPTRRSGRSRSVLESLSRLVAKGEFFWKRKLPLWVHTRVSGLLERELLLQSAPALWRSSEAAMHFSIAKPRTRCLELHESRMMRHS